MEPEVRFVGVKIPPKTTVPVDESLEPGSYISTLHITQFALAETPKSGRNTIIFKTKVGERFVAGHLERNRCEQFQADFMLSGEVEVINTGESEVHLTGYQTITNIDDIQMDGGLGIGAEMQVSQSPSLSEDDEDFEEEETRRQLKLQWKKEHERQQKALQGKTMNGLDNENDGEEDEDSSDGSEPSLDEVRHLKNLAKEVNARIKYQNVATADDVEASDGEDGAGMDGLDELDADALLTSGSSSEEDDAEIESGSSDEEGDEPPILDTGVQKLTEEFSQPQGEKRRSNENVDQAPGKKAKVESVIAQGSADEQWAQAILQHIKKDGSTKLGSLGSHVSKPQGVTKKLKQIIKDSKALQLGDGDVVSLA